MFKKRINLFVTSLLAMLAMVPLLWFSSCDFIDGAAEVYEEITTETLDTYTMEPRNKYFKKFELDKNDKSFKRFDIIMFSHPDEFFDSNDFYDDDRHVSRVIGMPNEDLEIRKGIVFINGVELKEPFLHDSLRSVDDFPRIHLNAAEYFVMVDKRKMIFLDSLTLDEAHKAYDSRKIGVIDYIDYEGRTNLK